jgi:hypothetical protein
MTDISTSGWDVVSITDLDTINTIINSDRAYPSEFSASDSILGTEININGKWGTWTVSGNASGGKVNIRCEITEGSVVYSGKTISFNDSSSNSFVEIELLLKGIETDPEQWVNNDGDIITDTTSCYQLMVDADNMVVVTDSGFTGADIAADGLNLILPALFGEWFQDNMSAFRQIFSVIIIGLKTENSDFQWLYPSAYSYAANSSLDNNTTGFGVLTLIDGKTDTGSLQQSVDIQALNLIKPFGANLALVVSKAMFVKHMLLAAAVSLIKDAQESDFTISETGLSLTNNREMLWQDFEEDEGKYISPVLPKESLILTLQSDYIHITIMGAHYRPRAGVTVYMGVEQNFRYKVEKNSSGDPVFVPDEEGLGDAVVSCSVKFDDWMNVLEITMGIIMSIAALISLGTGVAGILAARGAATLDIAAGESMTMFQLGNVGEEVISSVEGATIAGRIANGIVSNPTIFNTVKITSAVTAATTGIVFSSVLISEAIYKGVYDDVPSFHHFASSITGSSIWPGMDNIELKSASLADSFVIGLELK